MAVKEGVNSFYLASCMFLHHKEHAFLSIAHKYRYQATNGSNSDNHVTAKSNGNN